MDTISFLCPECGESIEADCQFAGGATQCFHCDAMVMIPFPGVESGKELGGFRIDRKLGSGGMGDVWLARQIAMDRDVALKILSPVLTKDSHFVSRFTQEVKILGKLHHPNIVAAFHAGIEEGVYFLAISFVDGMELSKRLEQEGLFSEREALEIILRMSEALRYAWDEFKILHRDIKPGNIMIDKKGNPKLMDLGVSKSMSAEASLTLTSPGSILGTPFYMSPEQAKVEKEIDCRSDIYSLGATLYHLLTGAVPHYATSPMAVLYQVVNEPLPDPLEKNANLSPACGALIKKMMAKDPSERHLNWGEVIQDVELILDGRIPPDLAVGLVEPELSSNRIQSNRKWALPALVSVSLIAVIIICVFYFSMNGKTEKDDIDVAPSEDIISLLNDSSDVTHDVPTEDLTEKNETHEVDERIAEEANKKFGLEMDKVKRWREAMEFSGKKPIDYDLAIQKFIDYKNNHPDDKLVAEADKRISDLREKRLEEVNKTMDKLAAKRATLLEASRLSDAVALYRNYSGPFASETEPKRIEIAHELEEREKIARVQQADALRTAKEEYDKFLLEIASCLVANQGKKNKKSLVDRSRKALKLLAKASEEVKSGGGAERISELKRILTDLSRSDRLILENLGKNIGSKIHFDKQKKDQTAVVKRIANNRIYVVVSHKGAGVTRPLRVSQLVLKEKIKRLRGMNSAAKALYACWHLDPKNQEAVSKLIPKTGVLEPALSKLLERHSEEMEIEFLRRGFKDFLNLLGMKLASLKDKELDKKYKELQESEFAPEHVEEIKMTARRLLDQMNNFKTENPNVSSKLTRLAEIVTEILKIVEGKSSVRGATTVQQYFHGRIIKFNREDLYIEIEYNFNHQDQAKDWRKWPLLKGAQDFMIEKGKLILETERFGGIYFKALFTKNLEIQYWGEYTHGNFGSIIFDEDNMNRNLVLMSSFQTRGFGGGQDNFEPHDNMAMHFFNIGAGARPKPIPLWPVSTVPDKRYQYVLRWFNQEAELTVKDKDKQPPRLIPFNSRILGFGLCSINSRNSYDKVRVKGFLAEKWFRHFIEGQ